MNRKKLGIYLIIVSIFLLVGVLGLNKTQKDIKDYNPEEAVEQMYK